MTGRGMDVMKRIFHLRRSDGVGRQAGSERAQQLSGIPAGTTGSVIAIDETPALGYVLVIEWNLQDEKRRGTVSIGGSHVEFRSGGKPLVGWFSRDEYLNLLREA